MNLIRKIVDRSSMKKQSANRRRRKDDDDDDDESVLSIDRLSELPQHILHHILSLLSQKDAVGTCLLSQAWRSHWHGRPNVEFIQQPTKREISPFLNKTLQRYHDQNLSISQFLVDVPFLPGFELNVLLDKWVPVVIMSMGVRALSLKLNYYHSPFSFSVPLVVFQAEFLVELNLRGCRLNQIKYTDKVLCKHLQTLCLHYVHVDDETFQKIMSSCPLIKNLDLKGCDGLRIVKLNNARNLKHFDCSYELSTEIESPCVLESIRISENLYWFLRCKNILFSHLKCLYLHHVGLCEESLDTFSSNFPCLNELVIDLCHGFQDFHLTSCSIKRLTIKTIWGHITKALIDTPNILYFEYSEKLTTDGFLPSIKFTTTTNDWKSHISVVYYNPRRTWLRDLNELLQALSQSHITLGINHRGVHKEDSWYIKLDSNGGFFKPVLVDTLRLSGYFSSPSVPSILNCFFRIFRPRYILMNQYAKARAELKKENNRVAEFICKLDIPKKKPRTRHRYFWLQDLEEVSFEVWDSKAKEWHCVQGKSLPSLPKNQEEQQIRFRFKWRDF